MAPLEDIEAAERKISAIEQTHTPGSWKFGRVMKGKYRGDFGVFPILQSGDQAGPVFAYLAQGRDDIQEANARLIAAAPDMADALRAAERKLVALRALLADHGISCPCTDEIVQVQDALIKAGV